jgi:hypothetical protein
MGVHKSVICGMSEGRSPGFWPPELRPQPRQLLAADWDRCRFRSHPLEEDFPGGGCTRNSYFGYVQLPFQRQ